MPTGAVYSLKCTDGSLEVLSELGKGARVRATHKARNEGSKTYREVLVEYKGPGAVIFTRPASSADEAGVSRTRFRRCGATRRAV